MTDVVGCAAEQQSRLDIAADYNRAVNTVKEANRERDAALRNVENLTQQFDQAAEAWRRAQAANAHLRSSLIQAMRRIAELEHTALCSQAVMSAGMTFTRYLAAVEAAKMERLELWQKEGSQP